MCKKLLTAITLAFSALPAYPLTKELYLGGGLSSASGDHAITQQGVSKNIKHDNKHVHGIVGYGWKFDDCEEHPWYVGVELHLPTKNTSLTKAIDSVIGGVRSSHKHEVKHTFPVEAHLKSGLYIDERVLLFGKLGLVHQRITHKAPTLNHSKSWQDASLLYGVGLSWDVNGKWKMTAEFIAHNTKEHKKGLKFKKVCGEATHSTVCRAKKRRSANCRHKWWRQDLPQRVL